MRWVSVAAVLVALAIALALLAVVARARREGGVDRGRQANVAGVSLGVAVAVYLCGLLAALLWTDTFRYAGWPVAAALGGSAAMIAAVAMAWTRPPVWQDRSLDWAARRGFRSWLRRWRRWRRPRWRRATDARRA